MGTKNNPGAYDCYAAAAPDEPMFILLGRDPDAPALVWLWSVLRELKGGDKNRTKAAEARQCAVDMAAWCREHGRVATGIGAGVLAGVFELIRGANYAVKEHANEATGEDLMRMFLTQTRMPAKEPDSTGD